MAKTVPFIVLLVFLVAQRIAGKTGESQICKWKDCKIAAFSIGGDDSLRSQTSFAIPAMTQRGIYGTWWVNTGRGHNELGFDFIDDEAYWVAAIKQAMIWRTTPCITRVRGAQAMQNGR